MGAVDSRPRAEGPGARARRRGESAARATARRARSSIELAERVRELVPSMDLVRLVSSGTEAAMSAVRVARAFTGRDKIVKFEGCYHGHADAFLVKAGSGATTLGTPTSPGVPAHVAADTLLARYNDLASVDAVLSQHRGQIAAAHRGAHRRQHGRGAAGGRVPAGLRDRCTAHGIVLIFDEVISGFRAAPGGAQALYGVRPDLTCLGKIIGGGLPVGAYGGRADIMGLVAPAGPVYQAGTLSGNPLAMTAGLWALDRLKPKLYSTLAARGRQLASGLARSRASGQGAAAGQRLRLAADAVFRRPRPVRDYDSALEADSKAYGRFFRGMLARGVYPPPSQFEAWFISAAHTERDIARTIAAAEGAMREVRRG